MQHQISAVAVFTVDPENKCFFQEAGDSRGNPDYGKGFILSQLTREHEASGVWGRAPAADHFGAFYT